MSRVFSPVFVVAVSVLGLDHFHVIDIDDRKVMYVFPIPIISNTQKAALIGQYNLWMTVIDHVG